MIAIMSTADDPHADAVETVLERRCEPFVRIDFATFPTVATSSVRFGPNDVTEAHWRTADGTSVDVLSLKSIWWRRPGKPLSIVQDQGASAFAANESNDYTHDLWDPLDVPALPAPRPVSERAEYKARQLMVAARLGFELPPTLITTDPDAALAFVNDCGGRLISKQAGFTAVAKRAEATFMRYTERVTHRDLCNIEALRLCPIILQAEVPKRHELRVTVVGTELFAVCIESQGNPRTSLDWRRYDDARTQHRAVTLPDEVAERCLLMCAALGVRYAAFDLAITPDGRHVFIEVNPNGQYLWLERLTGLPISETIAAYLASGLRSTSFPAELNSSAAAA